MRTARLTAAVLAALAASAAPAAAEAPRPTEVLVRFAPSADAADRGAARRAADVVREKGLPVPGLEVADPRPGTTVAEAVAELRDAPGVLYAEPDRPRHAFVVPNDPLFAEQWALRNTGRPVGATTGPAGIDIAAPRAWDRTTGSPAVTVAVVDSGLDLAHPDLAPNVWTNRAEASGARGVDDDRNGFVDDARGWDWAEGDADPDDGNGHGTHVAGILGARGGDGRGIAGTAWSSSILPLRALDASGAGYVSDVISAYAYAARAGVRVVNASLGGADESRAERDVLAAADDVLFVTAAGNTGTDNDAQATFPCSYELPNVVCVAASDRNDGLAAFSSFGARSVDLAAPGVDIVSTWRGRQYVLLDGTSMAAPFVSGAAALALALRPDLTPAQVRDLLVGSARRVPGLAGRVVSGGRLDAAALLDAVAPPAGPPAGTEAGTSPAPAPAPQPAPAPAPAPPPAPAPAPQPAPPAAPVAAPANVAAPAGDVTAPALTLRVARRAPLARVARQGLDVAARCSERCTVRVELLVDARTAQRLRLGATSLATATTRIGARAAKVVRVRVSSRTRSRLARTARVSATLRITARDAAGNVAVRRVPVALTR